MQEPNSTGNAFRNVGDTAQGSDSKSPACAGKRHRGWVMNGYWYAPVMEDLGKRPYLGKGPRKVLICLSQLEMLGQWIVEVV